MVEPASSCRSAFRQNPLAGARLTVHFQDIISTLNRFWADRGCLLLQPYDTEKGRAP